LLPQDQDEDPRLQDPDQDQDSSFQDQDAMSQEAKTTISAVMKTQTRKQISVHHCIIIDYARLVHVSNKTYKSPP